MGKSGESLMPKAYIGTSGYIYNHWSGVFYPEGLAKDKWLEYYCKFFDTVELNVTFYCLPQETAFKNWYKRTPDNFIFTLKGSRFITHIKKLNDCEEPLELFFNRAKHLKEKHKMILWQTPPNFKVDLERLEKFCGLLEKISPPKLHHAFEFRHESWFCEEVYQILEKYNVALVKGDYPLGIPQEDMPETADFVYLRRHGPSDLYSSNYSDNQLKKDAKHIKNWLNNNKDVFVYFNNDADGFAIKNALKLKKMIK